MADLVCVCVCVCVAVNRDLRDSWRYKDVLKVFGWSNLSGRFSLLFARASAWTVVIISRQTNPTRLGLPSSQLQMWTSKQFSHSVLTCSITGSASYTRSRKKNWQLNEIIHFLVWCHPKIAIIAQAWRLWSVTGRDTSSGRGARRGK